MDRSRRLLLAFVLALGLTVLDPPILDHLRYPAALVLSWPARALARLFGPAPRPRAILRAEAESAAALLAPAFPDRDAFAVFHVAAEDRLLYIVGGYEQGLEAGDRVLAGDRLVGFVDRVEARWSRLRLLGHRQVHVSGLVVLADGEAESGLGSAFLLGGSGGDALGARQGSRIDDRLLGREVFAPDPETAEPRWLVGRIERDRDLDLNVVRVAVAADGLDVVTVLGRSSGGLVDGSRAVTADVLAEGGGGTEPRSLLVGRGTSDGVSTGDWLSSGGRLLGRVVRTGPFSARVLGLADLDLDIPALVLGPDGPEPLRWRPGLDPGRPVFSRGRDRGASLPRGLLLPARGGAPAWPIVGESVTIHGRADPAALLRLGALP